MKATLSRPTHESYLKHRSQMFTRILLPVIFSAVLIVGAAVWLSVAALKGGGDVSRWGAISAIWVLLPLMFAALVFTLLLAALIYLMSRLLKTLPGYTGRVQEFSYRVEAILRRGLDTSVKPVFAFSQIGAMVKAFFRRR